MKWFLNRLTSLQGKKCLLISIEGMAKLWGCWGWVCFSARNELVFVLSTLLIWSAESKGSAVSVFPVVIETRPKCDKWLCHSAEKQNCWQSHQIPSGFWGGGLLLLATYPTQPSATPKTRKHMVFPVAPAALQERPGFGSSRMHWLEMPEETEGELIPNPYRRLWPDRMTFFTSFCCSPQSLVYTLIVTL